MMYLLSVLIASATLPAVLPDSVLFSDSPATMEQMRAIEGRWATSRGVPAMKFSAVRSGWMSLKVEPGAPDWGGIPSPFPVAVTTHGGQLFVSVAVRFILPLPVFRDSFQGKECYGTIAVTKVRDGIGLLDFDEAGMRAANSWYPKQMQTWEGEQMGCGNLVIVAEAARHEHVAIVLDPKPAFGGPLHRIPAGGLDKKRAPH